jgi:hypothetical protein
MKPKPPRKPKCKICYDKGYFTQAQTFGRRVKVVNIPCTHPKRKKGIPCNCECHSAYKGIPHRKLCCKNAFLPEKPTPRICEHEERHILEIISDTIQYPKKPYSNKSVPFSWVESKWNAVSKITRYLNKHVCKKCNKK